MDGDGWGAGGEGRAAEGAAPPPSGFVPMPGALGPYHPTFSMGTAPQSHPIPPEAVAANAADGARPAGLPPSLGLAAALMSFPAIATFLYGVSMAVAGMVFAFADSGSEPTGFQPYLRNMGPALVVFGAVVLVVGAIGLYAVVMVMAARPVGRTISTVFLALGATLVVVVSAVDRAGLGLVAVAVPYYALCFWGLWGRPGRSVF